MTVRRALAVVVRVLIGYSDVWLTVLLPGVLLFSLWELRSMQVSPGVVVASLVAWAFMAITLPVAMAVWRRVTVAIPWALLWVAGAVLAVGVLARLAPFSGTAAVAILLAGAALATVGLLADLVVAVVGAFGPGRSTFVFRPGLVLVKLVALALAIGALVLTAGTKGAQGGGTLEAIVFAMVLSAPALLALLVSPMFWGLRAAVEESAPADGEYAVPLADSERVTRARHARTRAGLRRRRSGGTIASTPGGRQGGPNGPDTDEDG